MQGPMTVALRSYGLVTRYTGNALDFSTQPTFDVNHPKSLVFFARTIKPHRLAAIRYWIEELYLGS